MPDSYITQEIIDALQFNAQEVLPSNQEKLQQEVERMIESATTSGQQITQYIGFEISGEIHIGTGIMSALKIKKLTDAGVRCIIWLADYHTWLNGKLDGDINSIRRVAKEYFAPVMLECCKLVECNMDLVEVKFAEQEYNRTTGDNSYWTYDLNACKQLSLSRVLKSISVTGKTEGEAVDFGTLRYAPMQVADAFFLQTQIVSAGMDQRKCHVLMREIAYAMPHQYRLKIGAKEIKPLASHHYLLHGLGKPVNGEIGKMSKSKPDTCIFVYDSPEDIKRKLKKAFAPMVDSSLTEQENKTLQQLNPMLDWARKMIFPAGKSIKVTRKEEWGGDKTYIDYESLEADYLRGNLHPGDLKPAVANCLIDWFAPLRSWATDNTIGIDFLRSLK